MLIYSNTVQNKAMKKRIAINGFGRIGRLTYRELLKYPQLELVAVNDLTDIPTLVHLLKYDSAHNKFEKEVKIGSDCFTIEGEEVKCFAIKDPAQLPWKDLQIDNVPDYTLPQKLPALTSPQVHKKLFSRHLPKTAPFQPMSWGSMKKRSTSRKQPYSPMLLARPIVWRLWLK